jgi:ATP-dependent RNA helicase DDX56/DBP9
MLFDKGLTFTSMGLDHRLLKAIAGQGFTRPTLVQSSCVKLALEARDVLVRAKTGSGKTLAYAIPIVQNILVNLERSPPVSGLAAIVLVPTRELVLQVKQAFDKLIHYCDSIVKVVHLVGDEDIQIQAMQLRDEPAIIVATPARLVEHCQNGSVVGIQDKLRILVVDEADLVLSYGYETDVRALIGFLPKVHQSLLLSATLSPELEALKALVLHNPAVVKLAEQEGEGKLTQFWIECASTDKYLLVYALLKLQIIAGKILFFVNSVESCFRLKLFLERFSIGSAVLNAELPANSRQSIITQFNRGTFNHLICTDSSLEWEEQKTDESTKPKLEVEEEEKHEGDKPAVQPAAPQPETVEAAISPRMVKGRKRKQNYGVSRGLDFKDVQVVVNVDFPTTAKSYVHRVGRTGRGGKSGEALSLVAPAEQDALNLVLAYQKALREELAEPNAEAELKLLKFNMRDVDAFRYRVEDVSRTVTSQLVKEARLKEIRTELLNSEKLKAHFEDNPRELQLLKHDKVLHARAVQPHLAKIPEYLKPKGFQGESSSAALQAKRRTKRGTKHVGSKKRKTEDPLTSFEFSSQGKKPQAIPIVVPPTVEKRFDNRVMFAHSTAGRRKWKIQHPGGKTQKSARQKKSGDEGPIYAS